MIRSLILGIDTQIIQQPSVINGTSYYLLIVLSSIFSLIYSPSPTSKLGPQKPEDVCRIHRPIVTLFYTESADFTLEDIDHLFRDNAPYICLPEYNTGAARGRAVRFVRENVEGRIKGGHEEGAPVYGRGWGQVLHRYPPCI
ncbi:hypothetical protein NA56DRAFT_703611 [Hyaloscypha hepaticicola]|uniref:Uncharacterized protein n=1 Tax=Hyaloscypha hepaticicola TaxID=2082293 RepID=A0A2J6Q568_9HELO|nr:hypothetical protein NA56DRAFT_703611 [Hyaloscypha hepaticicola]